MTSPRATALIIDDEPDLCELVARALAGMEIHCHTAPDVAGGVAALKDTPFDFCITDLKLPDGSGFDILQKIQTEQPELPVAMLTAHGDMDSAIRALKLGAFDFLNKPVKLKVLRQLAETALRIRPTLRSEIDDRWIGDSPIMHQTRQTIEKLAKSQAPVYISGESGVGKELAARLIHQLGPRRDFPFVAVNCGAIPADLLESELFGHLKGSFTGATRDNPGLFQSAEGGTLFLDEVADLPLAMQVKLLRAIQEKSVRPVGATGEIPVDIRVLSATHRNLAEQVQAGEFRQDLYYRINVIELKIPPLRARLEELPQLSAHLLKRIALEHGSAQPVVTAAALARLGSYHFPGNIRELENILARAATLCEGGVIDLDDLQLSPVEGATPAATRLQPELADQSEAGNSLEQRLREIEKAEIIKALEESRYNKTAAAKRLGLSFRTLRYRLKKLGIE
ncbi:MAG: sigma-54 dependent transcriptional regulator [Gammaproteobacteria bacterium]|nr:sigma-54 dependent transcriptional regulator [Gammaproteobacteria bacterium]